MAIRKNGVMTGRLTKEQEEREAAEIREAWDAGGKRAFELRAIDEEYGDNLPYHRERVENEAKFYMAQSAVAMLELGRRLLLLKEHEVYGEFLRSLERINMPQRTAYNVMKATTKLAGRSNLQSIANLAPTKMYELAMLDDDVLDELDAGATVAGLGLDAIDKMSTRELRDEVRRLNTKRLQESEAHEQLLCDKNKKIDEMSTHMDMITKPDGWHVLANELNVSTTEAWNTTSQGLQGLWAVYSRLINEGRGEHKENLARALPLVILHLQWHAQIAMESAQRLVDMIRHRLPMPWHPINMSRNEIVPTTKVEHLISASERKGHLIPSYDEEEDVINNCPYGLYGHTISHDDDEGEDE